MVRELPLTMLIKINRFRTLLNGENLRNSIIVRNSVNEDKQPEFYSQVPSNLPSGKRKLDSAIIQKGLNSLDNPMLRGSFSLVLDKKQLDFLDGIAKKAFEEVTSRGLFTVTVNSDTFDTVFLSTDTCGILRIDLVSIFF